MFSSSCSSSIFTMFGREADSTNKWLRSSSSMMNFCFLLSCVSISLIDSSLINDK